MKKFIAALLAGLTLFTLVGCSGGSKADSDRYRKAQARYSELQNESMRRLKANGARNAAASTTKPEPARTSVKGFGEATRRYVMTGTYESAQRRLENDVLRNMGY